MSLQPYHDRIINTVNSILSNERDRASEAGEDRERIGALIEQAGVHKKSMAFVKMLHKQEPGKRDDILRSFDALRAEFEKNWGGQKTADMFGDDEPDENPASQGGNAPSYAADLDLSDDPVSFDDDEAGDPDLQNWDGQNSGEMVFTDTVVPFASAPVGGDLADPDAAADAEADTWDDDEIAEESADFQTAMAEAAE